MFNEKTVEKVKGKELPVYQSEKYKQSKEKAIEIMKKYDSIKEGDFWILMNTYANGEKMMYSGLIISHNGCLKLNDALPEQDQFKPECVTYDKEGYNNSLVFTYCCPEQQIYEVGEFSPSNSKQAYPYAMAYKRLFDRVVLKNSRLAYDGIYSEVEADEFKQNDNDVKAEKAKEEISEIGKEEASEKEIEIFKELCATMGFDYKEVWKATGKATDKSKEHLGKAQIWVKEHADATGRNN